MQWLNVQNLITARAQTISTLLLLVVVAILNVWTLCSNAHSQTNVWQLKISSQQSLTQLKNISADIQTIGQRLQQNTSLSDQATKQILLKLIALQSAIEKLPSQQDINQVQSTLMQFHQQLLKTNTPVSVTAHSHAHSRHRHYARHHRLSPKALPFNVMSIDIWNDTTQATISYDGAPQLLAKGDNFLGWTLVALSYDLEMAVFKNVRGQQVTVHVV